MTAQANAAREPADDSPGDSRAAGRGRDRLDAALVKLALVLMLGSFASGLDTTIVNVTLDRLVRSFDVSVATVQWVSTGYMLALTMVMPLTGWAIGRFGARAAWLASLGTFLLGSMLCGIAWSMPALVAFRVLQGLGGGMLLPLVRVILGQAAGQKRMGRAMVFVAIPGSLTPALGPVLGGLVISALGWRWAFYINAPICLPGIALAWRLVPRDGRAAGQAGSICPVSGCWPPGSPRSWTAWPEAGLHDSFAALAAWLPLAIGAALLAGYAVHALISRAEPIIDLRLFTVRSFAAASSPAVPARRSHVRRGVPAAAVLPAGPARQRAARRAAARAARRGQGAVHGLRGQAHRPHARRTRHHPHRHGPGRRRPRALRPPRQPPRIQAVLGVGLFVTGLGQGAIKLTAFTITFRGLAREQMAPASSANRIIQNLGGVLGTVLLALILQHAASTQPGSAAFGHTFTWVLGFSVVAVIPALALPRRPQPHQTA